MPIRTSIAVCLALAAVAVIAIACKNSGSAGKPTPAPATATEQPATGGTPAGTDIRKEDLATQPGIRQLVASGGLVDTTRIVYADLTQDGIDDAVVPISSGGEGGDIAVFVYGYQDGQLTELLRVTPQGNALAAQTADGALTVTEPVFAQGDPLCCPSQLHRTTYQWDGSKLAVAKEETVPAGGTP